MFNKIKNKVLIGIAGVLIAIASAFVGAVKGEQILVGGPSTVSLVASTTIYAFDNTTNQQIVGTSSKRVAFSVQPLWCGFSATGGAVLVNLRPDQVATSAPTFIASIAVLASTTQTFSDRSELPNVQGSVRAGLTSGTCGQVVVTEWRTSF